MSFKERLLSRKFLLTLLFYFTSIGFVISGHLQIEEWINLSKWMLGIYALGNASEHAIQKFGKKEGDG